MAVAVCGLVMITLACGGASDPVADGVDGATPTAVVPPSAPVQAAATVAPGAVDEQTEGLVGGGPLASPTDAPVVEEADPVLRGEDVQETEISIRSIFEPEGQAWRSNWMLVEEAAQACMADHGFDYQLRSSSMLDGHLPHPVPENLSPMEYATLHGFGLSTGLTWRSGSVMEQDPNILHLDELSGGVRRAWELAYWGSSFSSPDGGVAEDGCARLAREEINGEYFQIVVELRSSYEEVKERFAADATVVELDQRWTRCMNSEGFDNVAVVADLKTRFVASFLTLRNAVTGPNAHSDGPAGVITAAVEARLEDLQEQERVAAMASEKCETPLRAEREEIWHSYEQEYLASYGDRLGGVALPVVAGN